MRQMEVVGVRVEMPTNQPIVLLKETQGERYLPIWIGPIHIGKYLSPCVSFSRTMGWFVGISTRTPTDRTSTRLNSSHRR